MKLFKCQACGNVLYFENRTRGQCGRRLAYLPEKSSLSAVEPIDSNRTHKRVARCGSCQLDECEVVGCEPIVAGGDTRATAGQLLEGWPYETAGRIVGGVAWGAGASQAVQSPGHRQL